MNDVLKDEVKRARYNQILEFGLPDWKTPIYYFRRVRKLSTLELSIAISIIITIGHYFVLWAQYFERKLTLEDRMDEVKKRLEKKQKKKRAANELDEIDAALKECYEKMPSPALKDILPYRFSIWTFKQLLQVPSLIKESMKSKPKAVLEEDSDVLNNSPPSPRKNNDTDKLHKSLNPSKIEKSDIKSAVITYQLKNQEDTSKADEKSEQQQNKNKEWTDKEKSDLIKAIAKFPAGTISRWNRISEFVGTRAVNECLQMEKMMKTNFNSASLSNLNAATWNQSGGSVEIKEQPTQAFSARFEDDAQSKSGNWSQEQQLCLEKALKEFGKDAENRWEKIAAAVPDKTKEECIERFKCLCAAIKKK